MLLSGQFNKSILILGRPGTCEKYGLFQCSNAKCILKDNVYNSRDDCGDNSDESTTTGTFCGMLRDTFCVLNRNLQSNLLRFVKLYENKREFVKSGFENKVK